MKKVMFVLVGLLVVSTFAFALESGPSNKVGYVKIQCNGGVTAQFTSFGLPFKFWYVPTGNVPTYGTESRKPSSIVGSQTVCGTLSGADRIARQDNGQYAYRNSANSCLWTGSLETNPANMEPGRAYWYVNKSGANRNLVLAGEADTTAAGIPTVTVTAPSVPGSQTTPYSWRDPRELPRATLNLLAQGFTGGTLSTSDRVLAQVGGGNFWYRTSDGTWQGSTMLTVTPGMAYWIQNKHVGHPFNYTYMANGQGITMPSGGSELQKISAPATIPTGKNRMGTRN